VTLRRSCDCGDPMELLLLRSDGAMIVTLRRSCELWRSYGAMTVAIQWSCGCGDPMELYSMPTPEGSNHHSHKNQHLFMTPKGSYIPVYHQRLPLLSKFAFCSPSEVEERNQSSPSPTHCFLPECFAPFFSRSFFCAAR
jgi:hypothetical protein